MTGAYTVIVTSAQGCTAQAVANVSVITLPIAQIQSSSPNCVGTILTFTGSGGATYNWSGPNGFTSNFQNPSIPNVQMAANGVYTLMVTAGTCSSSTTASVTINPLPIPTATSPAQVCQFQPINFGGIGGVTYTWTGPGLNSQQQNPMIAQAQMSNTGTYTLVVTNANGCVGSTTTAVVVNPTPAVIVNNPTTCVNTNINLTSSGGVQYAWSGPLGFNSITQNPVIPNAQVNMSGMYTVTVTTAFGCTNTAVANVSVIPLPNPVIFNSSPNCVGTNLTFTAQGGGSYNWSGPNGFISGMSNPVITNVQLTNAGTYSLIVTIGTCTNSATTNVTINPLPNPIPQSNSPVCLLQQLNLNGAGGINYSWSGPNGFFSPQQNPVIPVAQNTNGGIYTLTVVDANSCANSATTSVIINPLPTISTNDHVVCTGATLNHVANGGVSYSWTGPGGFTSNLSNPSIPNVGAGNAGQYLVLGTSAAGCTNTAVSSVTVTPPPMGSITSNTPCVGATMNLIGNGGTGYSWTGPNGFTSNQATPSLANVTLANDGIYTVVISAGNCTAMITASVMVDPVPTPGILSNAPVCEKSLLSLIGLGGYNFQWQGPNNFSSNGSNVLIQGATFNHIGTYTAIATDQYGCTGITSVSVNVNPLPIVGTKGSTICANTTITLTASGGTNYAWIGPLGFTSSGSTVNIADATMGMAGEYSVIATDANGCKNNGVATVSINPIPPLQISANAPICAGQTLSFTAISSSVVLFYWHGPLEWWSVEQNPPIRDLQPNASGIYSIHVHDALGCTSTATIDVLVRNLPQQNITTDKLSSCVPLCVNLGGQSTNQIISTGWNFGDGNTGSGNTASNCFNHAGHYLISNTYTDNFGCANTSTLAVDAWPIPIADFNISPTRPVTGENIVFTDATREVNAASWTWYFSDRGNKIEYGSSINRYFDKEGSYEAVMIVISDHGCRDTVVKPVYVGEEFGIYVPDAFSPNGDGVNDTFFPKGYGITNFEMNIFDRWGERLYTTTNIENGWDGKYAGRGGEEVKQDVYVWKIKLTDTYGKGHELAGKVTVIK
jgi:gliding motility-associated-like protein